jgi:hypothetical protein
MMVTFVAILGVTERTKPGTLLVIWKERVYV